MNVITQWFRWRAAAREQMAMTLDEWQKYGFSELSKFAKFKNSNFYIEAIESICTVNIIEFSSTKICVRFSISSEKWGLSDFFPVGGHFCINDKDEVQF